jgi:hypothetical protein
MTNVIKSSDITLLRLLSMSQMLFIVFIYRADDSGLGSLRHEPTPPALTLGWWVRIPLEAWMSVCVYSAFVLFCA